MPVIIGPDEVRKRLTFDVCMGVIRKAMQALSAGSTIQPLRSVVDLGSKRLFGVMPGALGTQASFGAKIVSVFPDLERPTRQAHRGVVVLFEPVTGHPVCIADAEQVTLIRTAAASAVATDVLARSDARTLGIFGCGAQAETHVRALLLVRSFDEIRVWGRSLERATAFARRMANETGVSVRAFASPEQVAESHVLCTVTSSETPVLKGAWVKPGTHVNAVGSSVPGPVELDRELVLKSRYFADSRASALAQAAEFLEAKQSGEITDEHLIAEIGEVLLGREVGRSNVREITLYKSLGHVVQDLAAVEYLYQNGRVDVAK